MTRSVLLCVAVGALGCNDAKTVDPETPSATAATPASPSEPVPSLPGKKTPMPTEPDPQVHFPGISDASFFDGSTSRPMADVRDELSDAGAPALRIDGPFEVDVSAQSELPLIGVFARNTANAGAFENSSIVVAVGLSHGGFHAEPALRSAKFAGDSGGAGGAGEAAFTVSGFDLDVFERLPELPQSGSRHQIYIVEGEFLSNGVASTLSGDAPAAPPEQPDVLVANTEPHADSPAAPAQQGVRLSVPNAAVSEPDGSVVLRGSVRGPGDTARVFLVATSDTSSGPFSFTVDVPLKDGIGNFNVDIVADDGPPKHPGQWHWYAFYGADSTGPASVRLDAGKPW